MLCSRSARAATGFKGVHQAFDLSKAPKDWHQSQPILDDMLDTGEKHTYRTAHADNTLWVFRPEGLEKGEQRP